MNQRGGRNSRKPNSDRSRPPAAPAAIAPAQLEQLSQRAKARGDLYEIFSLLFQEVPSTELLAVFKHTDFLQIVRLLLSPEAAGQWERFAATKTPLDQLRARLRLEYNNLFLLPTSQRVVPRQSAFFHEPGQPGAVQRRVEEIQKAYRRIGLSPLAKFKEQPDHLSQAMHFMSVLCEREKDYIQRKNTAQLESVCQIEADFVARHLREWIPLFRQRIHQATRFLFFRNVVDLMNEFITTEVEWTAGLAEKYGLTRKPAPEPREAPSAEKPQEAKPPRRRRRGGRRRHGPKKEGA